MSVNVGEPPLASSLRQKCARFAADWLAFPIPTYMRVFPPAIGWSANVARSVFWAGLRADLICVQLVPASSDRHTPPPVLSGARLFCGNGDAYTVLELLGSSATSVTPRVEAKLDWTIPPSPGIFGFKQTAWEFMSVKVAPPSVDFHSPYGGSPGAIETTPPLRTEETPRTPRAEPT